jgi:hypothetical protein
MLLTTENDMKLTVFLTPKNKILPMGDLGSSENQETVEYIFSFYTAEEREKYNNDLKFCEQSGLVKSYEDGSLPSLDTSTNTFTMEFLSDNVQAFVDYFMIGRENFKPIVDYFEQHPEEGTFGYSISS